MEKPIGKVYQGITHKYLWVRLFRFAVNKFSRVTTTQLFKKLFISLSFFKANFVHNHLPSSLLKHQLDQILITGRWLL